MNLKITGRHIKINDGIKQYLHSKLDYLDKYFDQIKHIEVIIDRNKNLYGVEIIVSVVPGKTLVSKISHYNYVSAMDILIDKMERQLTKFKERVRKRKLHHLDSRENLVGE